MPSRSTDASVAFSVTDNLSQSVVKMKNSISEFKTDAQGLQQQLSVLENTRLQLKNIDLRQAREQVEQTRKALESLGDAATEAEREAARANFDQAVQNYANVEGQLKLVSSQARQTQRDLLDATDAIRKADNRAGGSGILSALGKAGLLNMAGEAALEITNTLVGSAFGAGAGGMISSGISSALSGAAMGSLAGPIGTAVGAAVGGAIGLAQGGTQIYQAQDEAFKSYYSDLHQQAAQATQASLEAGMATAGQREQDQLAFAQRFGSDQAAQDYLDQVKAMAADTNYTYDELTGYSKSLLNSYSAEETLDVLQKLSDATAGLNLENSDVAAFISGLSRMRMTGKASREYLDFFSERGLDVYEALARSTGADRSRIADMASDGEIGGAEAAQAILDYIQAEYGGLSEKLASTYNAMADNLEDTMTELDTAMGSAYEEKAKEGLQADLDAYGGALGEAMSVANQIIGEGKAIADNLDRQYSREALSALTMGTGTTVYGEDQAARLKEMHSEYTALVEQYQSATEEDKAVIAAQIEALKEEAQAMADSAYDASEMSQSLHDVNLDLITAIRENTAALGSAAWGQDYETQQETSKGLSSTSEGVSGIVKKSAGAQKEIHGELNEFTYANAYGLTRVPYDNYLTYLHEGERVLTASQAREQDRGGGAPHLSVTVTGNTFGAGLDADEVAEKIADAAVRKLLAGYKV